MALLENGYKTAARTELERSIREIEERNKKAETIKKTDGTMQTVNNNIDFAQKLNLITEKQARLYRERIQASVNFRRFQRMESEEIVDDFENPRERAERFMTMEDVQAEISREKSGQTISQEQERNYTVEQKNVTDERTRC